MNPTEYFVEELRKLLDKHEEETGTYIERINIRRYPFMNAGEGVRAKRIIGEIELDIK